MRRRLWLMATIVSLAVSSVFAQPLTREEALQQLQPLLAELVALRAVNAMRLSPEQAEKLLPIARRAQEIWADYREQMRAVLREQLDAFTRFRAEDVLNVGFTPETERCTAIASERGKKLTKWLADSLAPLTEEAAQILTDEQRAIAEQLHRAELATALRTRLRPVVKRPEPPSDPVAQIRAELAAILRAEYGEITPLGRFLLNPALFSVLEQRLGLPPSPIPPLFDREFVELERTVRTLRTDINMLNLINGLYLSNEQLVRLREIARQVSELHQVQPTPIDPQAFAALTETLQAMKRLLQNGREVPPTLLMRASQLAKQAGLLAPRTVPSSEEMRSLAAQVAAFLTDEQKQVLVDYKPCLIPPKNLKDPVRVGQAPNNAGAIRALERLRQIPPNIYQRRKAEIIDGLARQIEAKGGAYPPEERPAFLQRLTELVEQVRRLSDAEFALRAEELATQFRLLHRKDALEERLKELTADRHDEVLLSKIVANLLNPRLAVVLEERLQVLANARPGEGKGLQTLTVANEGGVCPKPQ